MDAPLLRGFEGAVIVAQLVVPLVVAAPVLRSKRLIDEIAGDQRKARKARQKARKDGDRPEPLDAEKLAPLHCSACGATVPLEGKEFPCRHCGATIEPPPEYVSAIGDRQAAAGEIEQAERMWRLSRWSSAPIVLWPARIALVAWGGLVLFSAAGLAAGWPKMLLFLAIILAIFFVWIGLVWIAGLAGERAKLPPLPTNDVLDAPAADGSCTSCGAPVHFPDERVAMLCLYCTAEAYRVEIAKAEARKAKKDRAAAGHSLREALGARRDRRNDLALFVAFMGIAEIFYGVVFTIVAIADFVKG